MKNQQIAICLWFDDQAEEATSFYTSVFNDSEITQITRFGNEGFEFHKKPEGTIMSIEFLLNQMKFIAVNGGSKYTFNESVSIVIYCDTQDEIDYYWNKLSENGDTSYCGWLKDKFGVSWQITPAILANYLADKDILRRKRVEKCVYKMQKFDIRTLENAYCGN